MHRFIRIALVVATTPCAAQQGQQPPGTSQVQQALSPLQQRDVETRLFPLQYLSAPDAAKLVAPFVTRIAGVSGAFEAGASVRAITVTASRSDLTRIDSVLKAMDRQPVTIVLRFQLIAAVDSSGSDAGIPSDVTTTLRDLFRFGGYRILSEGTTTSSRSIFGMTMSTPAPVDRVPSKYGVTGSVESVNLDAGRGNSGSIELWVELKQIGQTMMQGLPSGTTEVVVQPGESLLSTRVSIPIGQTIVLGSAASATGGRRALILTVRPVLMGAR